MIATFFTFFLANIAWRLAGLIFFIAVYEVIRHLIIKWFLNLRIVKWVKRVFGKKTPKNDI